MTEPSQQTVNISKNIALYKVLSLLTHSICFINIYNIYIKFVTNIENPVPVSKYKLHTDHYLFENYQASDKRMLTEVKRRDIYINAMDNTDTRTYLIYFELKYKEKKPSKYKIKYYLKSWCWQDSATEFTISSYSQSHLIPYLIFVGQIIR